MDTVGEDRVLAEEAETIVGRRVRFDSRVQSCGG